MAKPWDEKPLWWKCYMDTHSKVYLHAGRIIGHLGCSGFAFYDAAKLLPFYDKLRFEKAVRDLTVYEKRERGEYELHAHAKKVLWIIIGPPPDHPEYVKWWTGRLVSVRAMRAEGTEPEFAAEPPVPLSDEKPAEPQTKKPAKARKRKTG
jgi:hypothetical protein